MLHEKFNSLYCMTVSGRSATDLYYDNELGNKDETAPY